MLALLGLALLLSFAAPTADAAADNGAKATANNNSALRGQLFGEADTQLAAATASQAEQFAPASFAQGSKHYRSAEKSLQRGRSIEKIKASLEKASQQLQRASSIAVAARELLSAALQAREDAAAAEAANFAAREWNEAEKHLASAIQKHEAGRSPAASTRAASAESGFRSAELVAIKNHYLAEARRLIANAEKQKVAKFAPQTLT
ncbi:MAG: hypothetical protein HKO07_00415, partial [Pseudomonadales bacterium]|nr:hypothetical protein [Pseudomonadales bacterium]